MESVFYQASLVTTGISLAFGLGFLIFGLRQKEERDYLVFGILCLLISVYFLLPPTGFIVKDQAPYSSQIQIKRIFIFGYYGLIPLFIAYYTRFRNLRFAFFVLGLTSVCYLSMSFTRLDVRTPLWFGMALVIFVSILVFGIYAGIWQLRHSNKKDAYALLGAMSVFAIGLIFTFSHQFLGSYDASSGEPKLFYPFHLNSGVFIAIMSLRMMAKIREKFKSERMLRMKNIRWDEFMQNAPVVMVELDSQGNIRFINKPGVVLLGYKSGEDLKGKNWFEHFTPQHQLKLYRQVFKNILAGKPANPFFKSQVVANNGKILVINWIMYLFDSGENQSKSIMCVGTDMSEADTMNKRIKELQSEIEKEHLTQLDIDNLHREEFIGKGYETQYLLSKISLVAGTLVPILIQGETGVGKELVADMIHRNSLRSDKPFIKVNCGALPRELIEDEFFGHEKGAFTSAVQGRKGRFELADGGTIFLDEIGELPLELQPKLLRVLHDGKFERVGGQKTISVDVRVLAATNKNLEAEVANGRFRSDLFYRLNVYPITIPTLRSRKEDLNELINYFVNRMARKHGKSVSKISKADKQRLMDNNWPGNIRELKNVLERSILNSSDETLKLDWFFSENKPKIGTAELTHSKSLEALEKEYILQTLEDCGWKINGKHGAAEKLALHPNTLRSRMKKLHIFRPNNGQ